MITFILNSSISLLLILLPTLTSAQLLSAASTEAKARLACGGGTVLAAEYLPGGLLKVTCSRNAPKSQLPDALQGTGLIAPEAIGVIIAVMVIAVAVGGGESGTTTTTFSSGRE